jgi:hypothetical protein
MREWAKPVFAALIPLVEAESRRKGKTHWRLRDAARRAPISGKLATIGRPGEFVHSDVPCPKNFQQPYVSKRARSAMHGSPREPGASTLVLRLPCNPVDSGEVSCILLCRALGGFGG